jgi:hypothetical protein
MDLNRRQLIILPAAAAASSQLFAQAEIPWQREIRRLGETNMTEHDPAVLDVEQGRITGQT